MLFARFLRSIGATLEDFVKFHQFSFAPEECETAGEYLSHMLTSHGTVFGVKTKMVEAGAKKARGKLIDCVARRFGGAGELKIREEEVCQFCNKFLEAHAKRHGWKCRIEKGSEECEIIVQ